MKRLWTALLAVAAFATAAPAQTIQFGTTGRTDATTIATFIAVEKKFFEAEKLQVNWITAGSAARAVQQTVAGSLDISIAATDATVRAFAEGGGLKIIAGTVGAAPFRTVGYKGTKGWADLKGKTISVGGPSDQTLFFFRIMARKNGLADKDYDLIYAGTTPARFSQLLSGQVGAAVLTNPNDLMALAEGHVDMGSAPDYVPVWSQNNAFVNAAWAKSHRAEVLAYLRALKRSVAYFHDPANRAESIAILKRYSNTDEAVSEKVYDFYTQKKIITPMAEVSLDGVQAVIDSLVATGELKTKLNAADMVDASFLAEVGR